MLYQHIKFQLQLGKLFWVSKQRAQDTVLRYPSFNVGFSRVKYDSSLILQMRPCQMLVQCQVIRSSSISSQAQLIWEVNRLTFLRVSFFSRAWTGEKESFRFCPDFQVWIIAVFPIAWIAKGAVLSVYRILYFLRNHHYLLQLPAFGKVATT